MRRASCFAVVAGDDHERAIGQPAHSKLVQQAPDQFIGGVKTCVQTLTGPKYPVEMTAMDASSGPETDSKIRRILMIAAEVALIVVIIALLIAIWLPAWIGPHPGLGRQ